MYTHIYIYIYIYIYSSESGRFYSGALSEMNALVCCLPGRPSRRIIDDFVCLDVHVGVARFVSYLITSACICFACALYIQCS